MALNQGVTFGNPSKLAVKKEGTYGSWASIAASTGWLAEFLAFRDTSRRTPADVKLLGQSDDYTSFGLGPVTCGFDLDFACKYQPHSMGLIAMATGACAHTPGASPETFQVTLASALPSFSMSQQFPLSTDDALGYALYEAKWTGVVANRLTLSHRQGDVMRGSLSCLAYDHDFIGAASTVLPTGDIRVADSAGGLVQWYQIHSTPSSFGNCHIGVTGSDEVALTIRDWRMTLDNNMLGAYALGTSRRSFKPVRNDKRLITLEMEIGMDAAWNFWYSKHGANEGSATLPFYVVIAYSQETSSVKHAWTNEFSNLYSLQIEKIIPGPEMTWARVSARAHYGATPTGPNSDPYKLSGSFEGTGYTLDWDSAIW
jgi:hypothetical protein